MAKKNVVDSNASLFDIVSSLNSTAEIIDQSLYANIPDWISTGSYILNAGLSGSLFGGCPAGRVLTFAGSPGSGKTFLALSICREAQKKGYTPIYMDSEGSIDKAFVERLGIDTKNFIIMQVNTISEVSTFISNLLLKINKDQKIILVLDSLGNLTSDKEKDDIINATGKRDMSKQQEIKALFRTNMVGLAKAHIPFIVNSHVYQTMDLFAKNIVSGGCLTNGNKIYTENGLIDISDINIGDKVLGYDNKYHDVLKTFKFEKPTIKFKFNDGTEIECSHDHKFLVDIDNMIWKKASELNENDIIYSLEM